MGECRHQKHTQQALSTKSECDYLNGWINKKQKTKNKKTVKYANISPNMAKPIDILQERRRRRRQDYTQCVELHHFVAAC